MISFSNLTILPEEIVAILKRDLQLKSYSRKVIIQKIIDRLAAEREITITEDEIQQEADRTRRERKLEKTVDALAWLDEEMISVEEWEIGITQKLLQKKLAQSLFNKDVERYYSEHKLDYQEFLLYEIRVPYERLAKEIQYQIEEEEISFYEAAHLYNSDTKLRMNCGSNGRLNRWSLDPEVAAAIFESSSNETIGPIKTELGYHLFRVEDLRFPELDDELKDSIIGQLFNEWLDCELSYFLSA